MNVVLSKNVTLTGESAAEVMRLLATGWRIESLGTIDRATVQRVRRRRKRAPAITPQQAQEMLALRKKGLRIRIIARRYGLSYSGAAHAISRVSKAAKGGAK